MELHVSLSVKGAPDISKEWQIVGISDHDKIAQQIGRAVSQWLRTVPVRKQPSAQTFAVNAQWVEPANGTPLVNGAIRAAKKLRSKRGK